MIRFALAVLMALAAATGSLSLVAAQSKPDLDALWNDLASPDAAKAFKAMGQLASLPDKTPAYFKERLKPISAADREQIKKLIEDLNSPQYAVRQKASAGLDKFGELAAPLLNDHLKQKPPLEVAKRIEIILEKLDGPVSDPNLLRALRAVEVLEWIGNGAAQDVAAELAKGAPGHRLTEAADDTVKRLQKLAKDAPEKK
jgi:hypothetical protein